ncbi:MAG: hypothetical protein IH845_02680 [Nanoarchaeota archaeon]|nr:hypothetical protein [Nanoarchaeota archaeon]
MRCAICKKEEDVIELFEGILGAGMIRICKPCSLNEGIPTIQKPSISQLAKADERYSVRERMEKMSGVNDKTELSDEQVFLQGNLAKLRAPPKKETNENVVDDYSWNVTIARRRRKLSTGQLAKATDIDYKIIQGIEKGRIPKDYVMIFSLLEKFLKVRLLKLHVEKINFKRDITIHKEREILKGVQERIDHKEEYDDDEWIEQRKKHELKERDDPEIPTDLENVTIDSLVERKRAREKASLSRKGRIETDAMLGSDIDLEVDMDDS